MRRTPLAAGLTHALAATSVAASGAVTGQEPGLRIGLMGPLSGANAELRTEEHPRADRRGG
ncbi:MAG: hypothetical protein ACKOTZ_06395 [Chloroflexota bacterium]